MTETANILRFTLRIVQIETDLQVRRCEGTATYFVYAERWIRDAIEAAHFADGKNVAEFVHNALCFMSDAELDAECSDAVKGETIPRIRKGLRDSLEFLKISGGSRYIEI